MMIDVLPLHDRVMVEPLEQQTQTAGGLHIPDSAADKRHEAKVIAVGTGRIADNGQTYPLVVKPGDVVYYGKYSGVEIELGLIPHTKKYVLLREEELLAIVRRVEEDPAVTLVNVRAELEIQRARAERLAARLRELDTRDYSELAAPPPQDMMTPPSAETAGEFRGESEDEPESRRDPALYSEVDDIDGSDD